LSNLHEYFVEGCVLCVTVARSGLDFGGELDHVTLWWQLQPALGRWLVGRSVGWLKLWHTYFRQMAEPGSKPRSFRCASTLTVQSQRRTASREICALWMLLLFCRSNEN